MILNEANPQEWHVAMLGANIELYDMDWKEAVEYFERLEVHQISKERHANKADSNSKDTCKKR